MTDHHHHHHEPLMPDFVATLEARLRTAAAAPRPARTPRTHRRLLAAGALALALAGVLLAATASDDRRTPTAYGRPLILSTPAVDVTRQLQRGISVRLALGPHAHLDRAHAIPVAAGTAYVVGGDKGWCLSAPDPAARHPDLERGVTCMPNAQFYRYGISLRLGAHYLAALPQGVKDPTLRTPDGQVRSLHPSALGVVVLDDLTNGSVITLYGPDGSTRADRIGGIR